MSVGGLEARSPFQVHFLDPSTTHSRKQGRKFDIYVQ